MRWAFGLTTKKDGQQMIINYRGKQVPGCVVDWLDNKGKVHHTEAPIYLIGEKKGYPKISIGGALDKTRKNFLTDLTEAQRARKEYRKAVRVEKANPEKYDKYWDAMNTAINKAYEGKPGKPMKHGGKKGNPYSGVAGEIAEAAVNRAISKRVGRYDKGKLSRYYEKRKKELEKEYRKQKRSGKKGPSMIYIDPKDGHMKIGRLDLAPENRSMSYFDRLVKGDDMYLLNDSSTRKGIKVSHDVHRIAPAIAKEAAKAIAPAAAPAKVVEKVVEKAAEKVLEKVPAVVSDKIYVAKKPFNRMSPSEKGEHARKVLGIKKDAIDPQTKRKYTIKKLIHKYNNLPVATKALHLPN